MEGKNRKWETLMDEGVIEPKLEGIKKKRIS